MNPADRTTGDMDDLDRLEALAEAATPGPRKAFADGVVGFDGILGGGLIPTPVSDEDKHRRAADAAFIAACDPATITRVIEMARSRVYRGERLDDLRARADAAEARVAELEAEYGEKYEALRDRAKKAATELSEKNERLAAEVKRLTNAITALADEHWDWKAGRTLHERVKALLAPTPTTADKPETEPNM